jgi:hypothetical protein
MTWRRIIADLLVIQKLRLRLRVLKVRLWLKAWKERR